jgi:magnesium transporter
MDQKSSTINSSMKNEISTYPAESIGSLMTTEVPTCHPAETLAEVFQKIASRTWRSVRNVYVVDSAAKLRGYIDMAAIIQSDHTIEAEEIMQPLTLFLHPHDDQEKAVFLAVKDDIVTIPVVDADRRFLGAVTAHTIIDIMHSEHIEDALLTAGVHSHGSNIVKLMSERVELVVKVRAPWLFIGLLAGLGLGLISSWFEEELQKSIALAYFIPVVAYIADSVGTQAEAIVVRALATIKINPVRYLLKELFVGGTLGAVLGAFGAMGALAISQQIKVALVVGLALFFASTVAAVMAVSIPILFKKLGKDPALGSGPLATAFQDIVSVVIYFVLAVLIL